MSEDITGPQSGSATGGLQMLAAGSQPRKERADAARNRQRILDAAERLFAEHGVTAVSMDAVAEVTAHLLLAPLAAEHMAALLQTASRSRIHTSLQRLTDRLCPQT